MFDKTTLDQLVGNLETGESDLTAKTASNTAAQVAASAAESALTAAQNTNRANVQAIKDYVAGLDTDGNTPSPVATTPVTTTTTPDPVTPPLDTTPIDTTVAAPAGATVV